MVSLDQERMRLRHLTRRRVLRGALLSSAGLAAATLSGCGEREKAVVLPAETQPKRGGTLRLPALLTQAPYDRGLDPHVQTLSRSCRMRLFYQGLVRANPRTWTVEPELAQKWEVPSPTELVFTLQPAVRWHNKPPADGRELRVEDVVYSLERIRTNDPTFVNRSLLDSLDKIEAVDRSRVRLMLKLADASLLDRLAAFPLVILAPEVVEKAGRFATADTAVGTGPFVLAEVDETAATHVRNSHYWKPGLPYLDQVLMPTFREEETKWSAFQIGRIDLMFQVPGKEARKYSTERGQFTPDGRFLAEWAPTQGMMKFSANVKRKPFDDSRVYRALRLLIDHEETLNVVVATITGRGRHSQAFAPAMEQWDFTHEEYKTRFLEWKQPKDEAIKVALDLLSAAGFTRDRPLILSLTGGSSADFQMRVQLLQAQWRQLSQGVVQPDLKLYDTVSMSRIETSRDYEVILSGAGPATAEPDTYLRTFYHGMGSRNYSQWDDPRVNEMIDRQRATFQVEQRKALIKEILLYLIDHAPSVVWAADYQLNAAQPKVRGWAPNADVAVFGFQYEGVWLETP